MDGSLEKNFHQEGKENVPIEQKYLPSEKKICHHVEIVHDVLQLYKCCKHIFICCLLTYLHRTRVSEHLCLYCDSKKIKTLVLGLWAYHPITDRDFLHSDNNLNNQEEKRKKMHALAEPTRWQSACSLARI